MSCSMQKYMYDKANGGIASVAMQALADHLFTNMIFQSLRYS